MGNSENKLVSRLLPRKTIRVNASEWNVRLCGGYLFNRKQKISFAGFIINFRVAPIHRETVLDSKHTSLSFIGAH